MVVVRLRGSERLELEGMMTQQVNARLFRRAQALVWLDDGDLVEEVADRLRVSRQSIYNWCARFERRQDEQVLTRLADGPRTGRPPTALGVIDSIIDGVIDRDPRHLGYRQTIWTADLLRRHLKDGHRIDVSKRSIHRAIARLGIGWKLPRHTLAHREWYWRQAKGGSNAGSRAARTPSS
jgi:transposase